MRGTKAKAVRRAVKLRGLCVDDCKYTKERKTGSIVLKSECGRAVYKTLKGFFK